MQKSKSPVLLGMTAKLLVQRRDIQICGQIFIEHHYLNDSQLVGEQPRYAVVWKGQWMAVAAWRAAAPHLKARDRFIWLD